MITPAVTVARVNHVLKSLSRVDYFSSLLMVGPVTDSPRSAMEDLNRPEIVTGAVVIRLEAGASAERIAAVVCALAASS